MIIELEVCLQLKLRDCESKLASNIELGSLINVRRKVIAYSTHVIASIGGEIASRREGGGGGGLCSSFLFGLLNHFINRSARDRKDRYMDPSISLSLLILFSSIFVVVVILDRSVLFPSLFFFVCLFCFDGV